jgi:hypothetical protein
MAKQPFPPYLDALILARQQARKIILQRLRAQGVRTTFSNAVLTRLAIELVDAEPERIAAHCAKLRNCEQPKDR